MTKQTVVTVPLAKPSCDCGDSCECGGSCGCADKRERKPARG